MFYPQTIRLIGMFFPGMTEMMIILFIAFLIFGAKKIPEIGHSLGKGIKDFQAGLSEPSNKDEESQKLMINKAPHETMGQVETQSKQEITPSRVNL